MRRSRITTSLLHALLALLLSGCAGGPVAPDPAMDRDAPTPEPEQRKGRMPLADIVLHQVDPVTGYVLLPPSGPGYYHFSGSDRPDADAWGEPETIACLETVAHLWNAVHPERPRIGIGDISRSKGGRFRPHKTHRHGLDVDIRPMSHLGEVKVHIGRGDYAPELTRDLIAMLLDTCPIRRILFNDRGIARDFEGVHHSRGHHNHLHVSFHPSAPAKGTPFEPVESHEDAELLLSSD